MIGLPAPTDVLGLDLGGTTVGAVRWSVTQARVVNWVRARTPTDGGAAGVVDTLARVMERLGGAQSAAAVGIASAGLVDAATGRVLRAANLPGFDHPVPLLQLVGTRLAREYPHPEPVTLALDNDVNALTRAEATYGAAADGRDSLVIALGTGVGGGLVLGGRVRLGPRGFSGEIGHVVVQPGGRPCSCGGYGHLEAYLGRSALEREARDRHDRGRHSLLVDLAGDRRMSSSIWDRALDAGDELALTLRLEAASALSVAITQAATLLDIEQVVLAGGFAPILGRPFRAEVDRQLAVMSVAGAPAVRAAALGDQAGAIGAALLVA
ncbi:MAG: ROK family protein [Actinomycetia bacterium]|nr:ROK family protein [Actinomycetes bacterium]